MKGSFLALLILVVASQAHAGEPKPRGLIRNSDGGVCWFKQKKVENEAHFFRGSGLGGERHWVLTFDDPACMKAVGSALDGNTKHINDRIAPWYSLPDAKFMRERSELYGGSTFQVVGVCMQSAKYPGQGVLLDYKIKNGAFDSVLHTSAINGCKQ